MNTLVLVLLTNILASVFEKSHYLDFIFIILKIQAL